MINWIKRLFGKKPKLPDAAPDPKTMSGSSVLAEATYDEKTEVLRKVYTDGTVFEYKGSSSVWHKMPFMIRCSTEMEEINSEIWEYIRHYGNPYPTAHKKNK